MGTALRRDGALPYMVWALKKQAVYGAHFFCRAGLFVLAGCFCAAWRYSVARRPGAVEVQLTNPARAGMQQR